MISFKKYLNVFLFYHASKLSGKSLQPLNIQIGVHQQPNVVRGLYFNCERKSVSVGCVSITSQLLLSLSWKSENY